MKSKKIKLAIFCAILFIGLLGIGSSLIASDLGVFKINSTIQLYQSCENCTFVNLSSVKLPNGSVLFYNLEMTKMLKTIIILLIQLIYLESICIMFVEIKMEIRV